ncbi:hypothetical protein H310_03718 [Aphanomyces invadans]|uniref:Uncharacterized protein n=1 Tax=Aphanomyces invadans TaxID=157072 RepID=A0A024UIV9_9STRA|nr:hypothetical protein H310_03718 [Aphanomyces invadans]ETW06130.1 hypothetical protein H310_03718 [Aphanomyces invadans]|eukprot:XP_008865907.1 hypothetical protein H310_03718 [Aphanomyces invadans]
MQGVSAPSDFIDRLDLLVAQGRHVDAFIEAAQKGMASHVKASFKSGTIPINGTHSELEWTALHAAAANCHVEIVEWLLANGADACSVTTKNKTPLALAVQRGHSSVVKLLRGSRNFTADEFVEAARRGNLGDVNAIVEWGIDVDATNKYGVSALMFAVEEGHVDVVAYLLRKGANAVSATTRFGTSLWLVAVDKGHPDIVRKFLRAGVSVLYKDPEDDSTALHIAAGRGHASVAAILVEEGADKAACTTDGDTPYRIAWRNRHLDVVDPLSGLSLEAILS